jgi:hypothetical protein
VLSARKEVRAAENKPAWEMVHEVGLDNDDGDRNTHKYEDTFHIVFEGMDPGFVVALCFI